MAYQQMEKVLHLAGHETHVASDELRKRVADALFELGLLERDSGHGDAALGALREAEQIFDGAEAALDLDHVRTAIAELEPVAKSA